MTHARRQVLWANKYVAGVPHLVSVLEYGVEQVVCRSILEPERPGGPAVGLQFELPSGCVVYVEGRVVEQWVDAGSSYSRIQLGRMADRFRRALESTTGPVPVFARRAAGQGERSVASAAAR